MDTLRNVKTPSQRGREALILASLFFGIYVVFSCTAQSLTLDELGEHQLAIATLKMLMEISVNA